MLGQNFKSDFNKEPEKQSWEEVPLRSSVKSVVFRLDFGEQVGLGHLARCSYLSKTFRSLGYRTLLLFGANSKVSRNFSGHFLEAFSAIEMLAGPDASACKAGKFFLERIVDWAPDLVVLDHYGASSEFIASIRNVAPVLAVDDGEQEGDVDYSVAYGISSASLAADKEILAGRLVGSKFALVTGFSEFSIEDPTSHQAAVTVSLGGGDTGGQAVLVAEAILGKMGERHGYLTARGLRSCQLNFVGPKNTFRAKPGVPLRELLAQSHRAVVTGGVSLMEAVAQGIPSVAFVTAKNQLNGLKLFRDSRDVVIAESLDFFSSEDFAIWWSRYEDPAEVKRAQLLLRSTVDSFGPLRVAMAVGLVDRSKVSLRRAYEADLPILFGWRQELDPKSGQSGFGQLQASEHLEWFERMEREGGKIWISEISGLPVGQVRIHRDQELQKSLLSYSVDALFRGRGIGASMLKQLFSAAEFPQQLWAKVHSSNLPSIKVLSAFGFQLRDRDNEGFHWMSRGAAVSGNVD